MQPIRFGLVEGRRALLPEEHQGDARLALARGIAGRAFGSVGAADAWLAAATPELGGLAPRDLIAESAEGSRIALVHLVRHHRQILDAGDG
jgi:hypothetical protein